MAGLPVSCGSASAGQRVTFTDLTCLLSLRLSLVRWLVLIVRVTLPRVLPFAPTRRMWTTTVPAGPLRASRYVQVRSGLTRRALARR